MWVPKRFIYLNNKSFSLNYNIFSEYDVLLIILNINIYIHQAKQKKICLITAILFINIILFALAVTELVTLFTLIKKYVIPIVKIYV